MGICSKHDWSSLGPERCPGCVSDEATRDGVRFVPGGRLGFHVEPASPCPECAVLRALAKQKEERITELLAIIERFNKEKKDAVADAVRLRDQAMVRSTALRRVCLDAALELMESGGAGSPLDRLSARLAQAATE